MTVDIDQAILATAGRIAGLVRPLAETAIPIPGSAWTVGEMAAHVAYTQDLFARLARGETLVFGDGTPAGLAHANRGALAELAERDGARLADLITAGTRDFLTAGSTDFKDLTVSTPMGIMDGATACAYCLTHLTMHGYPIARALGRPFALPASEIELMLGFIKHSIPMVFDSRAAGNLKATFELRLRSPSRPRFWVKIGHGEATVHDRRPARVDCFLAADPAALLLVALRLRSQWAFIARGKLIAWGPRPWLALRFTGMFLPP